MMPVRHRRALTATVGLITCFWIGCRPIPVHQGRLEREDSNSNVSSHQLRVMVNEFAVIFASRLEIAADQILAQASDPAIRKNALFWKINGISAGFQAASRTDPLGAYLDIWILNRQMRYLVDSRQGHELFGQWQPLASQECVKLEERLQYINETMGADFPFGERFVEGCAIEFPITGLYFDREPIASRFIQEVQEPARELFQVVANLDEHLEEMRNLSALYAEYLPKQARWEAQLLLIDTVQVEMLQQPLRDITLAAQSVSRIADMTERVPELVSDERAALQAIVTKERQATLRDVERMRRETLLQLAAERTTVLSALRAEREAISQQLEKEVRLILSTTDDVTRHRVDEAVAQMPSVIDHVFRRIWQMCLAVGLAVIALALVAWRMRSAASTALPGPQILRANARPDTTESHEMREHRKAA